MSDIIRDFEKHLNNTLAISAKAVLWKETDLLPHFMRDLYNFMYVVLMNKPFLLMIAKNKAEQTPATVKIHMNQLLKKWKGDVIYLRSHISSYNRQRLIAHKIPFIIPGTQMYLPMLGIDLREHFKSYREEKTTFSPSTQAAILYALYHGKNDTFDIGKDHVFKPSEMSRHLDYSSMTMTRAYEEMKSAGIGEHEVRGKERFLRFSVTGKALWEKVLPYLKTPVKKRIYVLASQKKRLGIFAGLSALALYSTLAEPKTSVNAISQNEWKAWKNQEGISPLPMNDAGATEIEVWSYPPSLFANKGIVDRLSLYLSLKDTRDERVEEALETMMEGMTW